MGKKCIRIIALFLIVCLGSLCGCVSMQKPDRTENRKGASEGGKSLSDIPENASDYIVVGFSQVGSESDWRNASTESFRKMFTAANGYYLLYEDAQQKQENQLKDVRNFILQEVDYIILDPPRDGIHPKVLPKILSYGVERIVYISCKPTSLVRDLVEFQKGGYQVRRACCIDMFPHTANIETVCLLSR